MSDNDAETLTHGLADALGGLIHDQLASIEERHVAALTAVRASERERLAGEVRALADEWETTYGIPALDPHPLTLHHAARLRALVDAPESTDAPSPDGHP